MRVSVRPVVPVARMVARTRIVRILLSSRLPAGDSCTRTARLFEALKTKRLDPRRSGRGAAPAEVEDFRALVSVRIPVPAAVGAVSLMATMPVAPAVILRPPVGMVNLGARSGAALAMAVDEPGTVVSVGPFWVLVDGVGVAEGAGALVGGAAVVSGGVVGVASGVVVGVASGVVVGVASGVVVGVVVGVGSVVVVWAGVGAGSGGVSGAGEVVA